MDTPLRIRVKGTVAWDFFSKVIFQKYPTSSMVHDLKQLQI